MNFLEMMTTRLGDNGLPTDMADKVVQECVAGEADSSMSRRWRDSTDGYDALHIETIWRICRTYALKHIDAHAPHAWFRPCFLPYEAQANWMHRTRQQTRQQL